jgi:predicted nucleic acid-binding OB-fold protein
MEAKHDAIKLHKLENLNNLTTTMLEQIMVDATSKARETLQHKLVKLLSIIDPNWDMNFFNKSESTTQKILI